ncbi:MAG: polysaccharide deacetylase family protein [Sphingomonadaceae bacterium]
MPAEFGRRFLLFVDTEEEFDWAAPRRRDADAVTAVAMLPEGHARLAGFGIRPTYLVDYPIANNPASAAILGSLADDGGAVIGAQLHPWVNPPLEEAMSNTNSFVGNLPVELERAKLGVLTRRIEEAIGCRPTVYRAGRYGVGAHTARLLIEQGYRLDVSIRSLFDYRADGGPDFSRFPSWPWWVDTDERLLELPLTAAYTGRWRSHGETLFARSAGFPMARGILARSGLVQRVALTPEGMPLRDVLEALRTLIADGVSLFSLSFHSPSLSPGHTPYVRDRTELSSFWQWWHGVLDLFARHGITSASVTEFLAAVDRAR